MAITLFVVPLKPGKKEQYRAFIDECLGARVEEYKSLLLRYGVNTLNMWLHNLDGRDYAMFTHDMSENAAELLAGWKDSTHPFDKWFDEQLRDCYEVEDTMSLPPQPEFIGAIDAR